MNPVTSSTQGRRPNLPKGFFLTSQVVTRSHHKRQASPNILWMVVVHMTGGGRRTPWHSHWSTILTHRKRSCNLQDTFAARVVSVVSVPVWNHWRINLFSKVEHFTTTGWTQETKLKTRLVVNFDNSWWDVVVTSMVKVDICPTISLQCYVIVILLLC